MIKRFFAAISVILLMASCASEAPSLITDPMYDEYFKKWVKKHAPEAIELENNIFVEYLKKNDDPKDTTTIKPRVSWVYFSYTLRTLNGDIFASRDSSLIRQVGTWRNNTHFVDAYMNIGSNDSYSTLCVGAQYGMTKMKTGEHARFYIPAAAAYLSSMSVNSGYSGSSVTYIDNPVIFEVRIDKIVDNPTKFESDSVEQYAITKWGQFVKDTIFDGIYLNKTKVVPDGGYIGKDSVVLIDFTEFFTDGFILNTNVDSIAKKYDIYDSSNTSQYKPTSITAGGSYEDIDQAIVKAVLKMRRGERADILTVSKWTLKGNEGNVSNIPQIEAYQPRLFQIRIYTKEEEKELNKTTTTD